MAWAILSSMSDRPGPAPEPDVIPGELDAIQEQPPGDADDRSLQRVRAMCPYLIAADGEWRSLEPAREHECSAVDPAAPVAAEKQRRLCLVEAHVGCATYIAARRTLAVDGDRSGIGPDPGLDGDLAGQPSPGDAASDASAIGETASAERTPEPALGRWPMPRTTPVIIERGGFSLAAWRPDRSVAQLGLVALMVLAFAVLAVARLTSDGVPSSASSPRPSSAPAASPAPSAAVSPSTAVPSASLPGSAAPSPSVNPAASPSPPAASPRTYRVKAGDSLIAIAARFGTTVAVLRDLNDIADPSLLRVGQILRLP